MEQVASTLQMAAIEAQDEEKIAQQRMMLGLDQSLDQMAAANSSLLWASKLRRCDTPLAFGWTH